MDVNTVTRKEQEAPAQGLDLKLFIAGGKVIHTQVGALPEAMLKQAVEGFLEKTAVVN